MIFHRINRCFYTTPGYRGKPAQWVETPMTCEHTCIKYNNVFLICDGAITYGQLIRTLSRLPLGYFALVVCNEGSDLRGEVPMCTKGTQCPQNYVRGRNGTPSYINYIILTPGQPAMFSVQTKYQASSVHYHF